MSTDMNAWNFNFCSLGNVSKTILKNIFWYIGIRNNSNCQESSDTDMSTSTNVEIFNFCSLGNAYKGNDSKSTNLNKFLMYFLSLDKAKKNLARFARTYSLVSYANFFKKQQEFLMDSNPAVSI